MSNATAKQTKGDASTLLNLIVDAIQDIKGKNIIQLDLREIDSAPADYFVICEGDSSTQIRSISTNIQKRIKEEKAILPSTKEGFQDANWVLVDYFDVVVHVFYPETRKFYDLEDLWGDAKITEFANL